jgi:hypothetical protein
MDQLGEIRRKLAHLQELMDLSFLGTEGDYLQYKTREGATNVILCEMIEYHFNPTLLEEEVRRVEAEHRIHLPDDYRAFLLEIGDGGVGPGHAVGLYTLQHALRNVCEYYVPSEPFPHTRPWLLSELPPEAELEDIPHLNGVITVAHHGCTIYNHLVVAGPEYGHIWGEDLGVDLGLWPITGPGSEPSCSPTPNDFALPPLTFLQWYEGGLDERIVQQEETRRWLQSPEAGTRLISSKSFQRFLPK